MATEEFWALFSPAQQAEMKENQRRYRDAGRALFADLAAAGFEVESMTDMQWPEYDGRDAVPILLAWYPKIEYLPLQRDILAALGKPWAAEALNPLLGDFRSQATGGSIKLAQAIGEAISHHANDMVADQLLDLASDPTYGEARFGIVLALSNLRERRDDGIALLLRLTKDPTVQVTVVEALGYAKAHEAEPELKEIASHHDSETMRSVASEALRRIRRSPAGRSAPPKIRS